MLKFPNSNVFFLHFSEMILSAAFIFVLLLGPRYVGCDSNTEMADSNWACVVTGQSQFKHYLVGMELKIIFHL